jgi:hypothetical protein
VKCLSGSLNQPTNGVFQHHHITVCWMLRPPIAVPWSASTVATYINDINAGSALTSCHSSSTAAAAAVSSPGSYQNAHFAPQMSCALPCHACSKLLEGHGPALIWVVNLCLLLLQWAAIALARFFQCLCHELLRASQKQIAATVQRAAVRRHRGVAQRLRTGIHKVTSCCAREKTRIQ